MAIMVAKCPRCRAENMTFDIRAAIATGRSYEWQRHFELCCECRRCHKPSLFRVSDAKPDTKTYFKSEDDFVKSIGSIDDLCRVEGPVNLSAIQTVPAPDHLPDGVRSAFDEGATCYSSRCFNAAGAMFRLSIDLATKPLLPNPDDQGATQPNGRQRRDLGLRLPWLFQNNILPEALANLATCIREDGNDGAHDGSLSDADAEDLMDFAFELHERLFTEPKRLDLAAERRTTRRQAR